MSNNVTAESINCWKTFATLRTSVWQGLLALDIPFCREFDLEIIGRVGSNSTFSLGALMVLEVKAVFENEMTGRARETLDLNATDYIWVCIDECLSLHVDRQQLLFSPVNKTRSKIRA